MLDRSPRPIALISTLFFMNLVCATGHGQTMPWIKAKPTSSPPARLSHAMVYDAARQQVVLFGGLTNKAKVADTWTWDGRTWHNAKPTSSPPARAAHAMAYDAARKQVVLFGGYTSAKAADTWIWDGRNWTLAKPAISPPARVGHAMAYDAARKQVVLFGGYTSIGAVADTWMWNGKNWTLAKPNSSPRARSSHALAYDAARQETVLFGGRASTPSRFYADTWTWNGKTWTPRITLKTFPSPRITRAITYDSFRRRIILFGGFTTSSLAADTWTWDGKTWTQARPTSSPLPRDEHTMAYDAVRRQVVLFGGSTGTTGRMNDTWLYGPPPSQGSFTPFGSGCGSKPGVALSAMANSLPRIGYQFTLQTTHAPTNTTAGVMSLGTSKDWLGPFPLPLLLDPFGMPGCRLYTSYDLRWVYSLQRGSGSFTLPIPHITSLLGRKLYVQTIVAAPKANLAHLLASNAGTMVIGKK